MMIKEKNNWFNRNIYTHRRSRDLARKKEEIKCNNIIKQYKNNINFRLSGKYRRKKYLNNSKVLIKYSNDMDDIKKILKNTI